VEAVVVPAPACTDSIALEHRHRDPAAFQHGRRRETSRTSPDYSGVDITHEVAS
jgi:hypothetical protein